VERLAQDRRSGAVGDLKFQRVLGVRLQFDLEVKLSLVRGQVADLARAPP